MGSAVTDQNGNYSIEFKEENVAGYRFIVLKNNYFDIQEDVTTATLQASESFSKSFILNPQSTIQIHVKNTQPNGLTDEIKWHFINADQSCKTCCNSNPNTGLGVTYDQTTECKVLGNRYLNFEWTITKNGGQTYHKDSIFMHCFNTEVYNLNY
jgi:hypothetical protein